MGRMNQHVWESSIAKAPQTPRNPEFMVPSKWATVDQTNHTPGLTQHPNIFQVLGFLHGFQRKDGSYRDPNALFPKVPVARYTAEPIDATKPAGTSWCHRKVVTLILHVGGSL